MKVHEMQQGSPEWHAVRRGIPTASGLSRILTPAKHEYSTTQSAGYIDELLGERFAEPPEDSDGPQTYWMTRGHKYEPMARSGYEFRHRVNVRQVGFVSLDDGSFGVSPDGLVTERNGLEIKCPSDKNHVSNLRSMTQAIGRKYQLQVQSGIYVCEGDWWDELSFHPDMPEAERRTPRDPEVIAKITEALKRFGDELNAAHDACIAKGCKDHRVLREAS